MKQLPTIESIEKEFDEKFVQDYDSPLVKEKVMDAYAESVKSFFRQKLTEVLEAQRHELKKKVEGEFDKRYKDKVWIEVKGGMTLIDDEIKDFILKLLEERKE